MFNKAILSDLLRTDVAVVSKAVHTQPKAKTQENMLTLLVV